MVDSKIQEFTRRITDANKSEMIIILYDMYGVYVEDALNAEDSDAFHRNAAYAMSVLRELIASVNRHNETGNNLYAIYRYVEKRMIAADIRLDKKELLAAAAFIEKLSQAYEQVVEADTSGPIMQGAEKMVAGMTYGRNDISMMSRDTNRGFKA